VDKSTGVRNASTDVVEKRRTLSDLAQGAYADLVGSLGVLDTIDYKAFGNESAGPEAHRPGKLGVLPWEHRRVGVRGSPSLERTELRPVVSVVGDVTQGTHLAFRNLGRMGERKTNTYLVESLRPERLGRIRWFAAWRRYCFEPFTTTVFDPSCLREIADFIEKETADRKTQWRGR
jgi:hypothetical protein